MNQCYEGMMAEGEGSALVDGEATALLLRTEHALLESEDRFRTLADGTPHMIWAMDADGRMEFANRFYCEFFGTTPEAVRIGGWAPLIHPDDRDASVQAMANAMKTHRAFRRSARVLRADGEWRSIDSSCVPRFNAAGTFLGMVGCSPDITDQKIAEERLLEQLRYNELLMEVLNHDLRGPLSTMAISVEVARETADSPTAQAALDLISKSAQGMQRLVEQLLDVAHLRSGSPLTLRRARADMVNVVRATTQELEAAHPRATFTLELRGDPCGDWDAGLLLQLMENLIGNAITHGDGSKRVAIRVEGSDASKVRVAVHNRGTIPAALLPVLFDPLKQSTDDEPRGLGLYIVKQVVLAHGGDIRVESDAASGTTFEFELPR
jgi:phosphoserine phosphatase RsbU/P